MKKFFRGLIVAQAAILGAASLFVFAGCDTKYPEVTITYEFNGKKYEVEYILTRTGAPQTVQHFIELADAGYYDGTVIHDYQDEGIFLYGGGYVLNEHGELEEKDYWSEVRRLEEEKNISFTQTVFTEGDRTPLYTVRGEFKLNGVDKSANTKSYYQNRAGTLVMTYMDKGKASDATRVCTLRSDGKEYQEGDYYLYNSATSLFYTFTSTGGSRTDLDEKYSAFGVTKDFSQLQALITAVNEYAAGRDENDPFINSETVILNQHDPFQEVRDAKIEASYSVPDEPIVIRSVKVNKY